jgi:molecular chaperone DnaK (HSP70)
MGTPLRIDDDDARLVDAAAGTVASPVGMRLADGHVARLIGAGTPVREAQFSETFAVVEALESSARFTLYRGRVESPAHADEWERLAECLVSGIPDAPPGALTIEIDGVVTADGALEVSAEARPQTEGSDLDVSKRR